MRQNKLFFAIIILSFIFFASIITIGGKVVFERYNNTDLKQPIVELVAISVFIFTIFMGIILFVSYLGVKKSDELMGAQKAIILSLANLAEWRDPETGHHLERTRNYGLILAQQLRKNHYYAKFIDDAFIDDIYHASPLHDIGKVGIPDSILLKPGKLTDDEFDAMKRHVEIGRDILQNIINEFNITKSFIVISKNIAASHHEKYDGTGYPKGLKGEAIPLEARIYALCDVYDALRAKRPYKEPMTHEKAKEIISSESGRHFDPYVIEAFLACEKEIMEVYETYRFFGESYAGIINLKDIGKMAMQWTPDLSVNVELLDGHHQEIFIRVNKLLKAILEGKGKEELKNIIKFLETYIKVHFETEEKYMLQYHYPLYVSHMEEHISFSQKFSEMQDELLSKGASSELLLQLQRHVVEWLITHISVVDRSLGGFLKTHMAAQTENTAKT
jgi:hemerythrin